MSVLFAVLCIALAYGAFCRATHLNKAVMLRIRYAVTAVGSIALYGLYKVVATSWEPDTLHVLLVAVFWCYLLAFSKTWPAYGIPPYMHREQQRKPLIPDHIL
jgi:hypothetical protein